MYFRGVGAMELVAMDMKVNCKVFLCSIYCTVVTRIIYCKTVKFWWCDIFY